MPHVHARSSPGLQADAPLHAAVHLPSDEVGNCRQFAQALRLEAQRLGAVFQFQRTVLGITPGAAPQVQHRGTGSAAAAQADDFDAVVVCAALGAQALLRPLGLRLPLMAVHGCSLTAPLRMLEGHPHLGPQAGVMDERFKVAISRLGQRVRVAGSAEVGGRLDQMHPCSRADAAQGARRLVPPAAPGWTRPSCGRAHGPCCPTARRCWAPAARRACG